jgi:small subunit ribosomal protein S2
MMDLKDLVKAGVHFGHLKARWCPKMEPYIWGYRNNIHLIDVSKTAQQLEKAAQFLQSVAADGKSILWVGTKKPARDIIAEAADRLDMPFVNHRWIGGTLSNHDQVKKSITKLLHYEDVLAKSENFPLYTKKEFKTISKSADRLSKNVGGIRKLQWPLGAIVLVDVRKERSALKEAMIAGVPVIALVDTNSDPTGVEYVIPANDDAPRSIKVLIDYLVDRAAKGVDLAAQKEKERKEADELKKAEAAKRKTVKKTTEVEAKKTEKKVATPEKKKAPVAAPKSVTKTVKKPEVKEASKKTTAK